jgi:hypothetical protein
MTWALCARQAFTTRCLWWHAGLHVSDLTRCLQILLDQSVRAHVAKFPHHTLQAFMSCLVHDCTSHGALHLLASSPHHQHVVHCSTWCFVFSCFLGDFTPKSVEVLGG